MTPPLRHTFDALLADEPPLGLDVDDIVRAGRRQAARRRRITGLSLAAALVLVAALVGLGANLPGRDGGAGVSTGTGSEPPGAPATGPAASGLPTTPTPGPSTADGSRPAGPTTTVDPAAPPPAGAGEQLPDPGFEATPPGWSTFGPATSLTPVGAPGEPRSGRQALRIETAATTDVVAGATNRPVRVTTVTGRRYQASCWARSSSPVGVRVQLQEYTPDWQRAADPAPSGRVTLADPARWYQVSVSYTAQASGNQLPLTVFSTDLRLGGPALLVDDCSLVAL